MSSWSGLTWEPHFLADGLRAPVPVPRETALAYRRALAKLLESPGAGGNVCEPVLATGAALLEGSQELIAHANRFAAAGVTAAQARGCAEDMLRTAGALLRHRNSAYALHQAAVIVAAPGAGPGSNRELPRIPRLKDFLTPLEAALERFGVSSRIEPERIGQLVVHLDEFYDDACLFLQRFFLLASSGIDEARSLGPDFLRRAYTDLARASFADHLLAEHEKVKEPGMGTGLLDLLPELVQALEAVA